ncbi:hypothetical protein EXIGLDRAFT_730810 [Exidia glandulosa HHB12029]|uniref:CsbD-like domain-containing protein n=1 Tax=Exidia glandulosa HHB12029 TaxID=1314781 RepID=A0A165ZD99_EXIGL|nr:hypothetical protein EXIGLDRAFT_730810 [Exidia glandulosa HHB12029]
MASTNTVPTTAQTSGAQHGAGLGKKIKGSVDVIHGAGEVLRGNAESAADAFGDAITGKSRPVAETQPATDNVAQKGAREVESGLDAARGRK